MEKLVRQATRVLSQAGCDVVKNTIVGLVLFVDGEFSLPDGTADIACVVPETGRWLVLECSTRKLEPAWVRQMRARGAVAGVARNIDDVVALLREAQAS